MTRRFLVRGRVQGVGYRNFARSEAARLGVTGFAANLADGSVEVVAEGNDAALDEFEQALRRGPCFAEVIDVITGHAIGAGPFTTFSTR
jgi:acylphosphatase